MLALSSSQEKLPSVQINVENEDGRRLVDAETSLWSAAALHHRAAPLLPMGSCSERSWEDQSGFTSPCRNSHPAFSRTKVNVLFSHRFMVKHGDSTAGSKYGRHFGNSFLRFLWPVFTQAVRRCAAIGCWGVEPKHRLGGRLVFQTDLQNTWSFYFIVLNVLFHEAGEAHLRQVQHRKEFLFNPSCWFKLYVCLCVFLCMCVYVWVCDHCCASPCCLQWPTEWSQLLSSKFLIKVSIKISLVRWFDTLMNNKIWRSLVETVKTSSLRTDSLRRNTFVLRII